MIQLWSVWNFSWFSLGYNKVLPFNYPLKTSIFVTSLLGGYMIYVYPRKITIKFGKYKIRPSYPFLILGDLIIHQAPMAYVCYLTYKKEKSSDNSCGANVLIPFTSWYIINKIMKINLDKIYGIKMDYLISGSVLLFAGHSICYHFSKKN